MPARSEPAPSEPALRIGVSGEGGNAVDEGTLEAARVVGEAVARAGAVLVTGGLGGVMLAAARGAHEAGGLTMGILPGDRAAAANPFIAIPVVTNLGHARNVVLVHTSEALLAIGGSYGTLSEVALALKVGVPVGVVGSWTFARTGHVPPPVEVFDDTAAAVAWALAAAQQARAWKRR